MAVPWGIFCSTKKIKATILAEMNQLKAPVLITVTFFGELIDGKLIFHLSLYRAK